MVLFVALPIIQSPTTGFYQIIDNNIVIQISSHYLMLETNPLLSI